MPVRTRADATEQPILPSQSASSDHSFDTNARVTSHDEDSEEEPGRSEAESDRDGGEEEEETAISPEILRMKLAEIQVQLSAEHFVQSLDKDEKKQESFLQQFRDFLGMEQPNAGNNVLHIMATNKIFSSVFLIQYMLRNHKERMKDKDNAQRQPLTLAIGTSNEVFVKTVLENQDDNAGLEDILSQIVSDEGNGIHKAIIKGLSPELTINLVNIASDKLLQATDGENCTPLHRAVEYDRCTEAQLDVVKALLKRGDSALDKRNKAGLSVYQHHFKTRPKAPLTAANASHHRDVAGKAIISSQLLNPSRAVGEEKGGTKSAPKNDDIKKNGEKAHDESSPTYSPNKGLKRTQAQKQEDGATTDVIQPDASAVAYKSNSSRKMTSMLSNSKKKKRSKDTDGRVVNIAPSIGDPVSADKIANEVKLQYLRSTFSNNSTNPRNHDTTLEFLYHNQTLSAKHISFNRLLHYKPMSAKSLNTGSYRRFEFDTALQCVVIGPVDEEKQGEVVFSPREDILTLFKWLKDKKVTNIIKVVIDDHKAPFHSDKAIIEAMKHFNIEIVDWSKPDMCPKTIMAACQHIRELHLSWSGLNGMLLAWGGTDGLANLPNLTDVYIRQINSPESEEWTTEKLDSFETCLNENRKRFRDKLNPGCLNNQSTNQLTTFPEIAIHRPTVQPQLDFQPRANIVGQEQHKQTPMKDHQWLEYMDLFATGIFSLPPDDKYINSISNLPAELRRDVRICLIDDGVDIQHKSIMERIDNGGRAFGAYTNREYRGMARPFYDSTTNHGTLMANMMIRVCPFAKITSYRLDTRRGDDSRIHFTVKSAADALECAVKQDFDIISMSWTVRKDTRADENNSADIARIEAALRQATRAKRLVFCSAPDTGDISPEELTSYFPVGCGIKELFRIGAAKADNTPWPQAGGRTIVDYILPGHNVTEKEGDQVNQNDKSLKTGSSIATALAAGLAALIIHVVRMAVMRTYELKQEKSPDGGWITLTELEEVRSHTTMRKVFDNMATDKMYVHVWAYFYNNGRKFKEADRIEDAVDADDSKREKWSIVTKLARDILSS
ncbi:hypothetical protein F5Y03DRAFT_401844 [Xylaria venustula]|nr:hypothetical protein F5Y03DRAFT_401844 [Xylaria venustula]